VTSRSDRSLPLITVRTRSSLRQLVTDWKSQNLKVALVPTMGALHAGHLDLVELALRHADRVIASVFVNPAQFAPHEDLARYPRQEAADAGLLAEAGCHALYAPDVDEMYPHGFATAVSVNGVSEPLEGAFRPQFFAGVATVVAKLLIQATPDVAIFGEKDWQQLQMIKRLVADLDLGVEIMAAPTRREADGLALSSRNAYLSAQDRATAPHLKQALDQIASALPQGLDAITRTIKHQTQVLLDAGFDPIDYLDVRHAETLAPWSEGDPARILVAAWLGKTRLIDNRGG
jgi:pantoate--beta-alanine ligase